MRTMTRRSRRRHRRTYWDHGMCAYYARLAGRPKAGPDAICNIGCWEAPACQTMHPSEGWPSNGPTWRGRYVRRTYGE